IGVEKIVNKLLQKRPEKRFQTGAELKKAALRELATLRDEDVKTGYLPLQIKWTAIMAVVVAVAMGASSYFILKAQRSTLTGQLVDSGIALTKFISVQAALPVLGEDWISLEALVLDASRRDTFSYLVVSDHTDTVRSATETSLIGTGTPSHEGWETVYEQEDIRVSDIGEATYNFSVPVLFNETRVGSVDVGLGTESIEEALGTTSRMLAILALAMVLTVSFTVYLFNQLTSRSLAKVTQALRLFGRHHHEVRISRQSSDEFGDLFSAFNNMADSIENLLEEEGKRPDPELLEELAENADTDISGISQTIMSGRTVVRNDEE
ncbi:MAG: HAMP domain-containing protein, partial [Pseudomonadota bacterium]